MEILFQLSAAFIGTVSFSILFSTPNKYLPQCGLVSCSRVGSPSSDTQCDRLFRDGHFCGKRHSYNLFKISRPLL